MRRALQAPSPSGRSTTTRRPLRALLPLAALGAALALSACQTQSPIQTNVSYVPSDGVPADLGAVQLRDLVVISSGKDQPGVISGAMSNSGSSDARVGFATDSGQAVYASAQAHSQLELSGPGESQVQLASVPAPGDVVRLTVQTSSAPAVVVWVPVLSPRGYYATLAPTSSTSSPSSSTTSTATPSPTTSATP